MVLFLNNTFREIYKSVDPQNDTTCIQQVFSQNNKDNEAKVFFGNAKDLDSKNLDQKHASSILNFTGFEKKKLTYVIPAKYIINPQLYNIHFVLMN